MLKAMGWQPLGLSGWLDVQFGKPAALAAQYSAIEASSVRENVKR
jgi:hypothetical protein